MRIAWLVALTSILIFAVFVSSGCASCVGKDVSTKINPNFDPSKYRWCIFENATEQNPAVDMAVFNYFRRELDMTSPPKGVEEGIIKVRLMETRGFCLPPDWSTHFVPIFDMPKRIEITITDLKRKDTLLTLLYSRRLFACDGKFDGCRNSVITGLSDAYNKAKCAHAIHQETLKT